ncbi:Uncharacterized membrane protein [Chitinophaga rupis]|uniref:Uncharacterized membrane protein n=1 Tax=Chitinophaga rupis TaxID=573321 RepID=A0A1H7HZB9_9BACT|nr:DUF2231 domain-containing protein [Chitinophaga rupis]SEK54490.1 Uncharacterized membrane protein [Chitinophaga rupis]
MLLNIFTFAGRLHPLIVHLPIGFLLLAVLFDLLGYTKKYAHLRSAVPLTLLAGFVMAVLACVFGYMLSLSGDYDRTTLSHHKLAGIGLALIAGLLFLLTTRRFKAVYTVTPTLFSTLLVGLFGLMGYAGHQGGNLTHGSDYLTMAVLTYRERPKPTSVEQAMIYEDVVQPMLVKKCGQCHQPGKLKGNLSVQNLKSLLKGGKNGPAVVAGKPDESELYKRITMDPAHEKFMPADGKPPLAKKEVEIIHWWIEKAMAAEGAPIAALKDNAAIKPKVAAWLGLGGATAPEEENEAGIEQHINPDIPAAVDPGLVENLRRKGLMVRIMLQHPAMLDVTLPAGSGKSIGDIKDDLAKVGKNIIWLNLSDNNFSDTDLAFLGQLTNLEKLRLEKNPIADGISDHLAALKHLEAVNLNETRISAVCVNKLEKTQGVKRVYSWKTAAPQAAD